MKIRLGQKMIEISKVRRVRRLGNLAMISFRNGETLKVVCGVSTPESKLPYFSGTVEDLKSLIQRLK